MMDSLFSDKSINVSDKLIGTLYEYFYKEKCGNKNLDCYKELLELDEKYVTSDSVYFHFNIQSVKHKNPKFLLHFSKIVNNELFVDVGMSEFSNTPFGENVYYYFRFDLEGNIIFICKRKLHGL